MKTAQKPKVSPKPLPKSNRKRNILLALLAVGLTGLIWLIAQASEYISITPDLKKITPISVVTGKTIHDIITTYPTKYVGVNKAGMQGYSFYDKDSIAKRMFFFQNGTCITEIIIPKDNEAIETYFHFLNRYGMSYNKGLSPAMIVVKGNWRIGDNGKITNVFFVCGEENDDGSPKDPYFVNTSLTLNEYLSGK